MAVKECGARRRPLHDGPSAIQGPRREPRLRSAWSTGERFRSNRGVLYKAAQGKCKERVRRSTRPGVSGICRPNIHLQADYCDTPRIFIVGYLRKSARNKAGGESAEGPPAFFNACRGQAGSKVSCPQCPSVSQRLALRKGAGLMGAAILVLRRVGLELSSSNTSERRRPLDYLRVTPVHRCTNAAGPNGS